MIDRVHFEKFKSLEDVTIDLGRLTALVGPNGCGKSSVLQGIHLLSQTGIRRPREDESSPWSRFGTTFGGARDPRRLASPGRPTTLKLRMRDSGGDELELAIDIPGPSNDELEGQRIEFTASVSGPDGTLSVSIPPKGGESALPVLEHPRVKRFVSVVYLHLDAAIMTRTSTTDEEVPRMEANGKGLASSLAWMAGAQPETLAAIAADLAKVVPGVRRILTYRERIAERMMDQIDIDGQPVWRPVERSRIGDKFAIEFDEGGIIPADLLSEGTVLALGLLTKSREERRPRLVLLDDIDRGLHIEAQAKLVAVLRELLTVDPEMQIVCSTHSPYLLDLFEPSEVRVLALDAKRHTQALALTAHPDFDKWRFGTQTGELWAALGNAWVTAQGPKP
jgi:energy-coupling factor transporter ATP-binding protein EcfA2